MDLLVAFLVFMACMIAALVKGFSMTIPLVVGLVGFMAVAVHRGYKLRDVGRMAFDGAMSSMVVNRVLCVIGFITAVWRVSGTIMIFVYYGMKLITPPIFLMVAFLLSCLLSYALGTSFGVSGTVGVIFMTLARSGGVDPLITAGVLLSGVYFGDRGSPVSSSATLVAGVTDTDIFGNVKEMMKQAVLPMVLCLVIYGVLSWQNPIQHIDHELMGEFTDAFKISLWAFVPAILMLLLPLLHVSVIRSMGLSIASGILVAWIVQGVPLWKVLVTCVVGYKAQGTGLAAILNGGGLVSMIEIIIMLLLSCAYSGIFNGTGMLDSIQDRITAGSSKIGRFPVMVILSFLSSAMFCNQTIAALMCNDLMKKPYLDAGASKLELAMDEENSVILIAGIVPWCIGCSVPLAFMGVDFRALPYACYLYLLPICYLLTKKHFYPAVPRG